MSGTTLNAAGAFVKGAYVENTANTGISATMPLNSLPAVTDGTEILTTSFTAANSANKIRINVAAFGYNNGGISTGTRVAIFQGSTCIQTIIGYVASGIQGMPLATQVEVVAGSGAVTYSVRIGVSGSTFTLNNNNSGAVSGSRATMSITEIAP
jgi:hypothetical protein